MSEVARCFKEGLLKRTAKSRNLALQDITQAEFFLNESFDLINLKKKEMASIALYNAAFHAARALLYLDGVKEKSHYCLQKYLEEEYGQKQLLAPSDLSLFDLLKGLRQEVQYNVTKIKIDEDLNEIYDRTEKFIEKIKHIVTQNKPRQSQ
ncbi:MAG: HEPN domain-containing protein [Candidatus Diapherotrites archaeon]